MDAADIEAAVRRAFAILEQEQQTPLELEDGVVEDVYKRQVVPVINKIDLPAADPERVAHEVEDVIGIPCLDAPRISAKNGINIEEVLERVVTDIPAPSGNPDASLKALIFDSYYDSYNCLLYTSRCV